MDDAARLHALAELFPGRTREQIITDLLGAALQEVAAAMPYVPGKKVISTDEQGDPVYEDAGLDAALRRAHPAVSRRSSRPRLKKGVEHDGAALKRGWRASAEETRARVSVAMRPTAPAR